MTLIIASEKGARVASVGLSRCALVDMGLGQCTTEQWTAACQAPCAATADDDANHV